ncbi:helix-hairpin-helix domain-containing protein [Myxococcaceae bacterium GXIMD 01537]
MGPWLRVGLALLCLGTLALPGGARADGGRLHYSGTVNLNEATVAELDLLPGVGAKAAQRIVEQRQKRRFQRVEELVRVKGFGRKKFLKLKPLLAVAGATTLRAEQRAAEPPKPPGPPAQAGP